MKPEYVKALAKMAEDNCNWLANAAASEAIAASDRALFLPKIWEAMEDFPNISIVGERSYSFYSQKNFNKVREVIEHLEKKGWDLLDFEVHDVPESRYKRLRVALDDLRWADDDPKSLVIDWYKTYHFDFTFFLAQDAECKLVEVSREPQPDRIKYRMECPEQTTEREIENGSESDQTPQAED